MKTAIAKKNNLFSYPFPLADLWDFLDSICPYHEDYYLLDSNGFRTMVFKNLHVAFLANLKEHYYPCQQFYFKQEFTFRSFTTLLRQLCNYYDIPYKITKQYNHSALVLRYFIEKPKS